MITDADIKKLKQVFATKDDLKGLEKRILQGIADYLEGHIITILNDHDRRIDRLEKHAGGFPPIS